MTPTILPSSLCWLYQVCGQAQILQGLVQHLRRPLRLAPITLKTFMRLQATALSGFGLLFGVSFAGGHSVLLQIVVLAIHGEKETMSPKELNFKHFHGPQSVPCVIGPPDRDTQKSGKNMTDDGSSWFERYFNLWAGESRRPSWQTDWYLFVIQKQIAGSNPIEVFCFKEVKPNLVRSMPWLANRYNESLPPFPSLEISLLDNEGKSVQSELITRNDIDVFVGGNSRNLIIPFEHRVGAYLIYYGPWIPIAASEIGYAMIRQEKSFHVLMAVEPSALRSAKTINVKLVN